MVTATKKVSKLNPANAFTFMRLPLAVLGFILFANVNKWLGVAVIVAAAWTDFFDGVVARRFKCESDFGAMFDPVVDKLFILFTTIFVFTQLDRWSDFSLLACVAVIEVVIAALTVYVKRWGLIFKVSRLGKKGMFARMMCVTWLLASTTGSSGWHDAIRLTASFAGDIGVVLGVFALVGYVQQWNDSPQRRNLMARTARN